MYFFNFKFYIKIILLTNKLFLTKLWRKNLELKKELHVQLSSSETDLNLTYTILLTKLSKYIDQIAQAETPTCIKNKHLTEFVLDLERKHFNKISSRSHLVRQMFILHQISLAFKRYNDCVLKLSYRKFRAKILYPNIVYILIRMLPKARQFLSKTIKTIYNEVKRHSGNVVQVYTNSFYYDQDVIRNDVLYTFLGNGLKKFNPLDIDNVDFFYKQVFRNILFYYFKSEQKIHTQMCSSFIMDDPLTDVLFVPTGISIYRDVMYSLQVEKMYENSPTLLQVKYNFNIFKNIILNNEFQNIYFSSKKDTLLIKNNHYKLTHIYQDDMEEKLKLIKKLPTIYRLLKSVHIMSKNKTYNETVIKPELVKTAVLEELIHPFRNMFLKDDIREILEQVAVNFTNSILSGEYINLMTLSPIKINQITFINQVRKFIGICLK